MSPDLHNLDIPQEELDLRNKARLCAAAVLLVSMSALVVIAPDPDSPFMDGQNVASANDERQVAAAD